jgi:FkbM family methyltransferase
MASAFPSPAAPRTAASRCVARKLIRRARALNTAATELAGLAPSRVWKARIWLTFVLLPFKERVAGLRLRTVRVRVCLNGECRDLYVSDRADFTTLHDVFVKGDYDVPLPQVPASIIDLGAHVGLSVLRFHQRFPEARILAVEPNPHNFEKLRRNVGHIPGLQLVQAAVGGQAGTAWLDVSQESWGSRLVSDPARAEAIPVPVQSLDQLIEDADFEREQTLLKVDVEGAEWDTLSSATGLSRYLAILGDLHRDLLPVPAARFFALFDAFDLQGAESPSLFRALQRPSAPPGRPANFSDAL